ncbi:cache domain-containing protein [uncultured Desulfobacter sp.]|uniref:cache domain-containing protein n=1 Tax=uncultured Desulfobacter sp. TaxID=240139 RepID=UPI0029C8B65C|nr:cache domain-containing protein [uncultured Desulfobacter sp.]
MKNLSIKFKLFLSYAVIFMIILSLGFSLLFLQVRGALGQKIKKELNQSNQTITDMIETTATVSIRNHLKAIAQKNREIASYFYQKFLDEEISEPDAKNKAAQVLLSQTVGDTGYLYCVDSKGIIVVHPQKGVLGQDLSFHKFIQKQISEKEGYLEYEWKNPGESLERPKALYMSYFEAWDWIISVSSYKSEFLRLIDIEDFKNRVLNLTFGETGYSFILNSKGDAVIHPELTGNVLAMNDANGYPFVREMIRLKKGYLTYWWKNPSEQHPREKFVAFDYIPAFDWIIISSSYTREVFSSLYDIQKTFLVILILVILISGGITLIVSTTITNPLLRFIRQLEKRAPDDWSSRLADEGNDEIGKLSTSFNRFMDRLDAYRKELISEIKIRKKAEKDLEHLKNLSDIIDSMPSILIGVDNHGIITQWNKKAQQATGISSESATGRPVHNVFPQMSNRMELIRQAIEGQRVTSESRHTRTQNNQTVFEDVTVYPLQAKGMKGGVIRIDDVTQLVRMEEMMIQSEKMMSVGGLAAGMAHEINNPLAGMLQNAIVMKSRLENPDMPANQRTAQELGISTTDIKSFMEKRGIFRMLEAIHSSGLRAAEIVNSMLSFARKSDADVSPHYPDQLLDQILELVATDYDLKKKYDFKSIKIIKEYADNLPMLPCESAKIQQVILNILRNGAQAMQDANTASPMFTIRIYAERASQMICIEIEDNGPGMDEETRLKAFDPFFTTKPVGIGTGLGLSVSYFIIIENHKGTIDVISEPGKGANFIIQLPIQRKSK